MPLVDVASFDGIEGTGAAEEYVRWMAHQRRAGADDAVGALGLAAGARVLDLGCGPGVDLAALAERVGATGLPIGLDRSATMAAASRTAVPGAAVVVGSGEALPFPSASFDGAWLRAVLVHAPDPAAVVGEVARVLRPGAAVVFGEPDQGSHLVATDEVDVLERILAHRRRTFRSPLVGRDLPHLAVGAGLEVVGRFTHPLEHRRLAHALAAGGPLGAAVERAVADGAISAEEAARYAASLEARDAEGAFLFAAMAMGVVARRPA